MAWGCTIFYQTLLSSLEEGLGTRLYQSVYSHSFSLVAWLRLTVEVRLAPWSQINPHSDHLLRVILEAIYTLDDKVRETNYCWDVPVRVNLCIVHTFDWKCRYLHKWLHGGYIVKVQHGILLEWEKYIHIKIQLELKHATLLNITGHAIQC